MGGRGGRDAGRAGGALGLSAESIGTTAAPLVVWGAGAIGGTLGAHFADAGTAVLLVDAAADHVGAIREGGLRIEGPVRRLETRPAAALPGEVEGPLRAVLLCVKAHHTAGAMRSVAPLLADDGFVVSVQNGLNERLIADLVGPERTVGCFVNFGADYLRPGVIHFGGRGAVVLGEPDGRDTARVRRLHALFRQFDDGAVLSDNIWGYLWSKLAYAAMLFATAITEESIADALDDRRYRPVYTALGREVVRVARAAGVRLESFDGFEPEAYSAHADPAAAEASLDALVAHNRTSAKTHSGIWRDLAVRKRRTEVDAQLGPVVEMGAAHGVPTPLTGRLIELVHQIERGERQQRRGNLDSVLGI